MIVYRIMHSRCFATPTWMPSVPKVPRKNWRPVKKIWPSRLPTFAFLESLRVLQNSKQIFIKITETRKSVFLLVIVLSLFSLFKCSLQFALSLIINRIFTVSFALLTIPQFFGVELSRFYRYHSETARKYECPPLKVRKSWKQICAWWWEPCSRGWGWAQRRCTSLVWSLQMHYEPK